MTDRVAPDDIRTRFSRAMSAMYRQEVPDYGTLIDLVAQVNADVLAAEAADAWAGQETVGRLSEERHGAIRVGTAQELSTLRRLFAVMGMYPVGYYDLTVAGIPVHSTAFRPIAAAALAANPFRVFTSLIRLDLVDDAELRAAAEDVLSTRRIFTDGALALIDKAEADGGLGAEDAAAFVRAALETFRWHDRAIVAESLYRRLHDTHRLLADVVSFHGPHINHLTPRTLDIDRVQASMPAHGIDPKDRIEGPPRRACPILLRQTSFKAKVEPVLFRSSTGDWTPGTHTARFGEIEQRGAALTPKGRALYDRALAEAQAAERTGVPPAEAAARAFAVLPDDYEALRRDGLAYFRYAVTDAGRAAAPSADLEIETWLARGWVMATPITYEDFLPVSAAGIFQSNLGGAATQAFGATPNKAAFEAALGASVADEFALYADVEARSLTGCRAALGSPDAIN